MFYHRRLFLIVVVIAFCAPSGCAQESIQETVLDRPSTKHFRAAVTTADFSKVVEQVDGFVSKYTSDQVLLVVDIDNTLLAMNQHLGSD